MSSASKNRKTSIKCFNCKIGNIWDLRFTITSDNQPKWQCDNYEGCNNTKRYGKSFSWASWDSLPIQIIKNESSEEKSKREEFEKDMRDLNDREIRDRKAQQAIHDSLPRIGRMDN